MEEHKRAFKGIWIPKEIWLHPQLNIIEKVLWAEIDSLDNEKNGGCTASNKYLAKLFGVTESRVSQIIGNLKQAKVVTQKAFNGRKRVLSSIKPSLRQTLVQLKADFSPAKPSIYKEEKIEYNKDETIGQADVVGQKNTPDTDKDNPSKYNTAKTNFSSVEEKPVRPPRKKDPCKLNEEIYAVYKKLHPTVTKSLMVFIPGAIKKFEECFKGEGKEKLIEALLKYSEKVWVKECQQKGDYFYFLPKNMLSIAKLEEKLLPLVIKPPKNEHLSETPQTEEELREAEEATARAFQKAFSADTE